MGGIPSFWLLGRYPVVFRMQSKITSGDLGARDVSIFVKHVCLWRSVVVVNKVGNSFKNYIEWCSQHAKRLHFGPLHEHIVIV